MDGNKGEIAESRAAREMAGKHMLALQADIFEEIAAAERAEHLARTSTDTAERRLENARRQAAQSELSVHLGESNVMEQVAAEILAIRAELEVLDMRARLQAARNMCCTHPCRGPRSHWPGLPNPYPLEPDRESMDQARVAPGATDRVTALDSRHGKQ
jgi:hypothetical protein